MRAALRSLIALTPLLLLACGQRVTDRTIVFPAPQGETDREVIGWRWRGPAEDLLASPRRIAAPFSDQGAFLAHEAAGRAYVFAALEGQRLDIELARAAVLESDYNDGPILIDLYRVLREGPVGRLVRVEGIDVDAGRLSVRMPRTADYILSFEPGGLINAYFGLRLELSAALEFPVRGRDLTAVRSFFGDDRDGGARSHEGVDIFAPRSTPIVAVADGRAVPNQEGAGGTVVYLNAAGISYYYAHLERTTLDGPRRVRAGEVLGFIGNTGNAARTAPHLHFGIYDWGRGRGAVDPVPHLTAHRFEPTAEAKPLPASAASLPASDASLPTLVASRPVSSDRLVPSSRGAIVWLPAPTDVPVLARSDARASLRSPLGASKPALSEIVAEIAIAPRRLDGIDVFRSGRTIPEGSAFPVPGLLRARGP